MPLRIPQTSKRVWQSSLLVLAIVVGATSGYVAWLRSSTPEATASITNGQNASNALGQYDDDLSAPAPVYTTARENNAPGRLGLLHPDEMAIDSVNHRLFVVDSLNIRVLVFNMDSGDVLIDRVPDYVLGQPDFHTATVNTTQSGLSYPVGLAYDSTNDRLFVADNGNNRVLAYDVDSISNGENATGVLGKADFTGTTCGSDLCRTASPTAVVYDSANSRLFVAAATDNRVTTFDVATITNGELAVNVLGQPDFSTVSADVTQAKLNSPNGLAYDSANTRLFVADPGNNRVIVYDTASISDGENAINVLGQSLFTVRTAATSQTGMNIPQGVAYDSANTRLFVADRNNSRITTYDVASISNGENATGVLGQSDFSSSATGTTQAGLYYPSAVTYGSANSTLYVAEYQNNRVMIFDVASISNGENATNLLGQHDGSYPTPGPIYTKGSNNDTPNRLGVFYPQDAIVDAAGSRLFVSDAFNDRVLVYSLDGSGNPSDRIPDYVLGQANFYSNTAASTQSGMDYPFGLAYDAANTRLFVAHGGYHRVLVYDVASISNGENATGVLGQSNFTDNASGVTQSGMYYPHGLAYDAANTRLFVAQRAANRVTVYDVATVTNGENATGVLGQFNFTASGWAASQTGMDNPKGLAYDSSGSRLFVSEASNNRVKVYDVASVTNGEAATGVLGQANFSSNTGNVTQDGMYSPSGIAYDPTNSRLFVAQDNPANRVTIYDVATVTDGENATNVLGQSTFTGSSAATNQSGLNLPFGIAYDSANSRLWVADTYNHRVLSYDLADLSMSSAITGDNDTDGKIDRVVVTFNQDLDASTVTGADFSVTSPSYTVSSASETSAGVVTIVLTEGGSADSAATPTVNIVGSVQNNGNTETAVSGSEVTTDGAAPVVMTVSPADSATGVYVNADLVITFSEAMDTGFVEGTEFSVSPDPGSFSPAWTVGNTVVTLSHAAGFAASSVITVTTAEAQIAAAAGSPSGLLTTGPQDGDWSFTTGTGLGCPFTDGDGGTSGIQVSGSVTVNADTDGLPVGGFYDCTASFVEIKSGVTVTLQGDTTSGDGNDGVIPEIHFTDLEIESGATMSANATGCAGGTVVGSGNGPNGSNVCAVSTAGFGIYYGGAGTGAGHGGVGGATSIGGTAGVTYGSATAPVLFGSGGGGNNEGAGIRGGNGGGSVRLDVAGTLTNDGTISANGGNGASVTHGAGGGSGGSVYVTVLTLDGSGSFQSKGGNGASAAVDGGGGGGGRIAITRTGGSFAATSSNLLVTGGTNGGGSGVAGTVGTAYVKNTSTSRVDIFHGFTYATDYSETVWNVDSSATNQYCNVTGDTSPSITAPTVTLAGTLACTASGIASFVITATSGTVTMSGFTMSLAAEKTFTISGGPSVTLSGSTAVTANVAWSALTALTIGSSASIAANATGCAGGTVVGSGNGPNGSNVCTVSTAGFGSNYGGAGTGAGHGGAGGATSIGGTAGVTYGSATAPVLFGSGGGGNNEGAGIRGGNGGGSVRLDVAGTLTNDGTISANGGNGAAATHGSGGGSGGSVYVTVLTLDGSGSFQSKGGNGASAAVDGGGGGGGRIAITRTGGSFAATSSNLLVTGGTNGGGSGVAGTVGTAYVKNTSTSRVDIFHGFTYATDYSETTWAVDSSATNQYCDVTSDTSPSVSAGALTIGGTVSCSNATLASFNWSASTSFDVLDDTSFTVGTANTNFDWNIPAGDSQTWTGITITGPAEGDFTINDAVAITLSGASTVTANALWTALTALTIGSSASIAATAKGCAGGIIGGSGNGPNGSNVCTVSTAGFGSNYGGAGTGAGHGGAGGATSIGGPGGVTYGSATAPVLFGSGGGGDGGGAGIRGGNGGGSVRLDVAGTLTNDGTISANGGNGAAATHGSGGGSGGSVYITTETYSCTIAPTIRAIGGNGASAAVDGGGGGGGRVRIEYNADTCSAAPLTGLVQGTIAAGGTNGGGSGVAGSAGSLSLLQNDDPPAVSAAVNASPSAPTVNQTTTISATFTDDNGVNRIQLYQDGTTDPTHVIKTCTFSPAQSPASCSITVGPGLSDGSHTIRAAARDTASQTTNSDSSFTVGSFTTSGTMTLSRLKAGVAGVDFALQFALTGPDTAPLTVTFPAGFTVTQAFTSGTCSGGGTVGSFGYTGTTLTATKTACVGTVTLSGAKITNHSTPGTYVITWTNDSGSGSVSIVDDDMVTLTANVDPTLTFDIDLSVSDTETSTPYNLDFGALTPGTVSSSGTTFKSIWIDISTNASSGAIITVRNTNGSSGLVSTSTPADTIPNSAAAMSSGTANFGLCVVSVTQTAGTLAKAGNYTTGTCAANGTTNDVKGLTTSDASILSTSTDPIDGGRARISVNVNALSTTPAHNDYTDTFTLIATGTY